MFDEINLLLQIGGGCIRKVVTTTEERLGLIKGLREAVKGQLKAPSESQAELQQLAAAIESSSNSHSRFVSQNSSSVSTNLCLSQVTLPVYKGQPSENLNRFTNFNFTIKIIGRT